MHRCMPGAVPGSKDVQAIDRIHTQAVSLDATRIGTTGAQENFVNSNKIIVYTWTFQ